jgi:hypothetical protein
MRAQARRQREHETSGCRQLGPDAREYAGEDGNDPPEEHCGHDDRGAHDDSGIDERSDDRATQLCGLFEVCAEAVEHGFEDPAELARPEQGEIQRREHVRMRRRGVAETAAGLDPPGNVVERPSERSALRLLDQEVQAPHDGETRTQHDGELTRSNRQRLRPDSPAQSQYRFAGTQRQNRCRGAGTDGGDVERHAPTLPRARPAQPRAAVAPRRARWRA